jgi:hypothetical protein
VAESIPDGYHSVTPYLIVKGAAEAIVFYKTAFDAVELMRMQSPDGRIGHAEIRIGDSVIMLADEHPEMGYRGPKSLGGAGVSLMYTSIGWTRSSRKRSRPEQKSSNLSQTSSTGIGRGRWRIRLDTGGLLQRTSRM